MTQRRTQGDRHDRVWRRLTQLAFLAIALGLIPAGLLWGLAGSMWATEWLRAWCMVLLWITGLGFPMLCLLRASEILSDKHDPGWRDKLLDDD